MEDRFHSYGAPGESYICILKIQFKINSQVTMGLCPGIHISALAWDHERGTPRGTPKSTIVPALCLLPVLQVTRVQVPEVALVPQ